MADYMTLVHTLAHGLEIGAIIGALLGFAAALLWRPVFGFMRWRLERLERRGEQASN